MQPENTGDIAVDTGDENCFAIAGGNCHLRIPLYLRSRSCFQEWSSIEKVSLEMELRDH
jgi:hypothetical protein